MRLLKTLFEKRAYVFGIVSLLAVGVTLMLALILAPWLYTKDTTARVYLDAPAETKIRICWDTAQSECLPLAPYLSTEKRIAKNGEMADLWLTELPPRPAYAITIIFNSELAAKATFHTLNLRSNKVVWGYIAEMGVQPTTFSMDKFQAKDITYTAQDNSYSLESKTGGRLIATQEIKSGTAKSTVEAILSIWCMLFSLYLLFALPIYLLPFALTNLGSATQNRHAPSYPWWAYLLCGLAILSIVLWAIYSPIMIDASDQLVYLDVAMRGDWFIYAARPPGYYMFVAFVLWLSKSPLETITLIQAVVFAFSASVCIWVLRKWLHPVVAVLLIFAIFFSPSQVRWMLSVMRESFFASLILLGITSAIAHFTASSKRSARIWLVVFSIVCGLSLFIRENGILMPVVLLPVLIPQMFKRLITPGTLWQRAQSIFQLYIPYAAPVLCTAIVYFGMSTYNYVNYQYFQFTRHSTSHHLLWRELTTANFDARSLLQKPASMSTDTRQYVGTKLYRAFVVSRATDTMADQLYVTVFPTIHEIMIKNRQPVNWFHSAGIIDEIGAHANKLTPWQADLAGMLRQYWELTFPEFLSNPDPSAPQRYRLLPDDPPGLAYKQKLLDGLAKKISYTSRPTQADSLMYRYYDLTKSYGWYHLLFFVALFFGLYVLRYHDPVLLAPLTLFIANALLMLFLRMVLSRFVECLDILLILQVALGLSCWITREVPLLRKKFPTLGGKANINV
jgi:hypothetical protein